MVEVSKEQFFKAISGPEDVHPRSERTESVWEINKTRHVIGRSEPGFASPFGTPERWFLTEDFATKKGIHP